MIAKSLIFWSIGAVLLTAVAGLALAQRSRDTVVADAPQRPADIIREVSRTFDTPESPVCVRTVFHTPNATGLLPHGLTPTSAVPVEIVERLAEIDLPLNGFDERIVESDRIVFVSRDGAGSRAIRGEAGKSALAAVVEMALVATPSKGPRWTVLSENLLFFC